MASRKRTVLQLLLLCLFALAGASSIRDRRIPFRSIKAPAETISNYEVVRPVIIHRDSIEPHPRELWFSITTDDHASNFTVKLELNEYLIPHNFKSRHYDDSGREVVTQGQVNCIYHGRVLGHPEWTATMSTCHGLQGSFGDRSDKDHYYHLEPLDHLDASLNQLHALYLDSEHRQHKGSCGTNHTHHPTGVPHLEGMVGGMTLDRLRRQTRNGFLFVEWIVVNDNRQYIQHGRNSTATVLRALEVANAVDSLFRVLNIRVALIESITWSNGDQITVTADPETLLDRFRDYRPQIRTAHDSVMLLTGIDLTGNRVGIAFTRAMCSETFSVGLTQDGGRTISSTGSTAAHELGHIFNMGHDEDTTPCTCTDPSQRCIMAAVSGIPAPTQWSSCSRADLNAGLTTYNLGRCLANEPTMTVGDPVCGNGIREGSEACDCGSPQECTDSCCNATMCQLAPGAQCSTGACCNSTCQFRAYGTTCRAATGECDIAEYCSGDSGECPADDHRLDGTACASNTGYCFDGECPSHNAQCQFHFGSGMGVTECYENWNVGGNVFGNCGHNSTSFLPCATSNVLCGQLHCAPGTYQQRVSVPVTIANVSVIVRSTRTLKYCLSFTTQPGGDTAMSPGLVRDGTKCGNNMVCLSQQCTPVSQLTTLSCATGSNGQVCSGNGQCNNRGQCSCNVGFSGTTCQTAVTGPGMNVNECATNNGGCAHTCTDTVGSFTCSCRSGFVLASNGLGCNDINECSTNNGGCAHNCANTQGFFTCSCRNGFQLASDGRGCNDINECSTNYGGCAHNCANNQGSFMCSCRSGFQLASDGRGCNDINECNNNNGGCAQTCTNSDGSFQCSCNSGFRLNSDGRTCNVRCGRPITPDNGSIETYRNITEGAEIFFKCNPGFVPAGKMRAVCGADGRWNPDSTTLVCTVSATVCEAPVFSSGASGVAVEPFSSTIVNSEIVYQCQPGLLPEGRRTLLCEEDGRWSPDPQGLCTDKSLSTAATAAITAVVCLLVAFISGALCGALVPVCISRWNKKEHSSKPAPNTQEQQQASVVYEEVDTLQNQKFELKENVAYGPVKQDQNFELKENVAYGPVKQN